ncbi:MAG TPA: hypothetical protein VMD30_12765 [Tepidisphaeraceae bacterium]|nr:hypothetical protein [Tepidisphaeraceae bacterium]
MTLRRFCFVGACILIILVCGNLWARQGIIHLKDGSPDISGDINDDPSNPDYVSVNIHGIQTTVPRDNISSIEYPASLDDQFKDRMSKLDPKDIDGRLQIAQWASDHNRYDLARQAVLSALTIDPNDARSNDMLKTISSEMDLTSSPPAPQPPSPAQGNSNFTAPEPVAPLQPVVKNFLSDDDINIIRQLEMKPTDDNLRVQFKNDVCNRYLAMSGEQPRPFYAQPRLEQAREILNNGDPSMAKDVRIVSDPSSLLYFHNHIQPIVLSGCAAAGCHDASTAAGGFGLYVGQDSTAAWYTNFYILQTYALKNKTPQGAPDGEQLMIDRTYPDQSLILQYGLPARLAATPHPAVPNFHQVYMSPNDPRYQLVHDWIVDILKPNGGDYPGVHYKSSFGLPSTQPAVSSPQ